MDPNLDAAIDIVEAAYDLQLPAEEWLPNLLRSGESLFDLGMGCYAAISAGVSDEGVPVLTQIHDGPGAEDLAMKAMEGAREAGPPMVAEASQAVQGRIYLLSEIRDRWPKAHEILTRRLGCNDILSVTAVDPDGRGVHISMPSRQVCSLAPRDRRYWQMLEVHLAAGHRLRRGLGQQGDVTGAPLTDIPMQAEALIDPSRFLVSQAIGAAKAKHAVTGIREAARLVDRARGPLRRQDPEEALRLWKGLVRGKWTLVDWFDTDGRRFVLAKPNAPRVRDPRGLTEREAQVATYASLGETSKLIGYRLGISQSYVSRLLGDAMRKLRVKTQAQLVERMRMVEPESSSAAE